MEGVDGEGPILNKGKHRVSNFKANNSRSDFGKREITSKRFNNKAGIARKMANPSVIITTKRKSVHLRRSFSVNL